MSNETVSTTDAAVSLERRMFFYLALTIAGWVILGFGSFIVVGISSVDSPWWVHVHAVSFVAWIVLYVYQNRLVAQGEIDRHRRIGRVGAFLAAWMVIVALLVTPTTISAGRVPPFFTASIFLALDWVNIVCFGGLVFAALSMRGRPDWHKRLMLCATICVIAPAFGRLLALAGAMTPWNDVGVLLLFVGAAAFADRKILGRLHPAFLWGGGAIFAMAPTIAALNGLPAFQDLAAGFAN